MFQNVQSVCMQCCRYALGIAILFGSTLLTTAEANALEIYAASIFTPDASDPDPLLEGILKIDLDSGDVTTFIPESAGFDSPTDVAVHPTTGNVYVSTLNGSLLRFDSTGSPLATAVVGQPAGTFAVLDQTLTPGNFHSTLHFDENGTLNVGTLYGEVISYDTTSASPVGYANLNAPTFQTFDSVTGLSSFPTGELAVMAGGDFQFGTSSGSIYELDGSTFTEIVSPTDTVDVLGGSNPTIISADGDYNLDGVVDQDDYDVWVADYGNLVSDADGNSDGVVDAADYTVWRDNLGEEAVMLVADLHDNAIKSYKLDGSNGAIFAEIPPEIPTMLPETANQFNPSNSPSEILVTDEGTLLVSLLGLTLRPDNRGAILEYDMEGNLLQTFFVDTNSGTLPPISGIAFVPKTVALTATAVPEPASGLLLATLVGSLIFSNADSRRRA